MELTLNLVWVCVAVAGILAQAVMLSRGTAPSEGHASTRQKIVAMGCALVILFFVISMTDDLHNQQVLVEERKGSRIAAVTEAAVPSASARAISVDLFLFFPPKAPSFTLGAMGSVLSPCESLFVTAVEGETLYGRAPPASLI